MKNVYYLGRKALYCLIPSIFIAGEVSADDYIVPPMKNISAGSFLMGSNNGHLATRPLREEHVEKFRITKYPITVAEFRKYVKDTGVTLEYDCKDHLGKNWLYTPNNKHGGARWDKHRFLQSEYQPVTCVSWKMANDYAAWLTKKTGVTYRLPTNTEFEYALKANTTSRFFWGDDLDGTQACKYANVADQSGEYFPSVKYGASYVGFLGYVNCNDFEPYISIVGMYRPNPFGLYDMTGNISQLTSTCYPEASDSTTDDEGSCMEVWYRGESWHFPTQPPAYGWKWPKSRPTTAAAMGFRLVANNHSNKVEQSTRDFETKLAEAKSKRLTERQVIPDKPTGLQLNQVNDKEFELSWQSSADSRVIGYEVYQSNFRHAHLMGGFFKEHYKMIADLEANTNTILLKLPIEGGSYRVVSKTQGLTSLPSEPKVTSQPKVLSIPGRLDMENAESISGGYLAYRKATKEKPELYYLSYFSHHLEQIAVTLDFTVSVKNTGWYVLNYKGTTRQNGTFFTLWQGDNFVDAIRYDSEIDDSISKRHRVYLEQGEHVLQLVIKRTGGDFYNLGWLQLSQE